MSKIGISGAGAVSPAGWGIGVFNEALALGKRLPVEERVRPGREDDPSLVRPVPKVKLPIFRNPRLRRTSPVGRYIAAAALEAIGDERGLAVKAGELRLGVVTTLFCGCVNYSQRFYREVLADPHTASPIVFPETVFNAPSSHLSAMLGSHAVNYTMIGDTAEFLCGLEIAAGWLLNDEVDGCVVVCAEEFDWLTAEAMNLFQPGCVMGEGSAALYLEKSDSPQVELAQIAGPELITSTQPRREAEDRVREAVVGNPTWVEPNATRDVLGEGLGVAGGWQCLFGFEKAKQGAPQVAIGLSGVNEHCAAAVFHGS